MGHCISLPDFIHDICGGSGSLPSPSRHAAGVQKRMRNLIDKMLQREVWGYWYLTSQSGIEIDPDLKSLRKPWADPVCKENIMVSPLQQMLLE